MTSHGSWVTKTLYQRRHIFWVLPEYAKHCHWQTLGSHDLPRTFSASVAGKIFIHVTYFQGNVTAIIKLQEYRKNMWLAASWVGITYMCNISFYFFLSRLVIPLLSPHSGTAGSGAEGQPWAESPDVSCVRKSDESWTASAKPP